MSKKVVTFGEIMLRLATPGYLRFSQAKEFSATFGGGEANVAVSLANYGLNAEFVTRMPKNDIAKSCEMDLHKYGVKTDNFIYGGDRLGIYFLETGAVARASKVVYDRAHSAIAEIKPGMIDWEKVLKGADWFHWTGITPALSQGRLMRVSKPSKWLINSVLPYLATSITERTSGNTANRRLKSCRLS